MDYDKQGRDDGARAGFQDGLDGKPVSPSPDLAPSLASIVYLHAYTVAYEIAHAQGREAREAILSWRAHAEQAQEHAIDTPERGDV